MKKLTLLFICAISTLVACKKHDAERNIDRLIGRWSVESVAYVQYENGVEKEREKFSDLSMAWEFRNNSTATVNFDSGDQEVTWVATKNTLQITSGEAKIDFQISSLTKNYMHVIFENHTETRNGIVYKETIEFKLRK